MHAAEGRDLGRDDALVDAEDAVFGHLGRPTDLALLTLTGLLTLTIVAICENRGKIGTRY
jgi:hypothetical protein